MTTEAKDGFAPYFVPAPSMSPVIINIGILLAAIGLCLSINALGGGLILIAGLAVLLFGVLKWPDIVSAYAPLDATSPVGRWFERMNSLYDGYAGKARTVRH